MKDSNDNQMELLLRTLGANKRAATRPDSALQSDHLDADEMNALAEGHVSKRTRARYIAHMADCDSCRSIVASLVQAAGVVSQTVAAPKTAVGFWSQLKTYFSPSVLRYAIPALVLAAVVGVSFLALRQQPASEFVAKNQESAQSDDKKIAAPSSAAATSAPPAPEPSSASSSVAPLNSTDERTAKNSLPLSVKPGSTSSTGETTVRGSDAAPVARANTLATSETQAAPPPPPKPDTATVTSDVVKEEGEQRQARRRESEKAVGQPSDEDSARTAAPQAGAGMLSARKVQELPASRRAYELKRKDANGDEEARSVGGRQFRREGSAWVDTAFSSGRSTINVTRGSEQYRTLMGDEPGLRAIVEQLGGEVVVVWKGRAYRIR